MDSKRGYLPSISDLGPELLNAVFCNLGPSPMYLAPVPSVCKAWRAVMEESTWKQLCLSAAPALCTEMKYDEVPPLGGWRALYKLLFYCPGIFPVFYQEVVQYGKDVPWCEKLGHVTMGGFMTGPDLMADGLRFRTPYREDVLFVSHACWHYDDTELCGYMYGCRGLVRDFPNSRISAALKSRRPTTELLNRDFEVLGKDPYLCAYCREPLYDLPAKVFFDNNHMKRETYESDSEEDWVKGRSIEGYVCCNGHLTLGVFSDDAYHGEALSGTGGDLVLKAARVVQACCLHLGPSGSRKNPGPDFVKDLDLFSLPQRVEAFLAAWEADVVLMSLEKLGPKITKRLYNELPGEPFALKSKALTQLLSDLPEMGQIFEGLKERFPNTRSAVRQHLLKETPNLCTTLGVVRRQNNGADAD